MIARLRIPALLSAIVLVAGACAQPEEPNSALSGDLAAGNPTAPTTEAPDVSGEPPTPAPPTDAQSDELQAALAASPPGCDLLDTRSCFLPFPSDFLTVEDVASPTLRRVELPQGQLRNTSGAPLDTTAWNLNDGFSPSTPIVVLIPGLDAEATGLPSMTEIGKSITAESPTVVVDLDSGQLVPHWAELDSNATDDADRSLIIHPAASLIETHRIAVVLRNLRSADGGQIPPSAPYAVLRDNLIVDVPQLNERRDAYDVVFSELAEAGINRADTTLTWWFTVSSSASLAGRVLDMRDDAMGMLAGGAPEFRITEAVDSGTEEGIARIVRGTFEVPLYLDGGGAPGSRMVLDSTGRPVAQGMSTAEFTCVVPEEAVRTGEARPVVYGHGLLGGRDEVESSHVQRVAAEINAVYCGTDALGLSEEDIGTVAAILQDLSLFPSVPDRLQQAMLNYLYLGRLMLNVDGLGTTEEFTTEGGANLLNTAEAFYDGNSQGAILGGAVTAIAQDWTKASLGVGGMGYATLLNRSVDFEEYFAILRNAYPDPVEQQVLYGVIQMLWDRGETAGYVQHLTDRPYDNTPAHQILMNVAFGDHQVANVTADTIARTLKVPMYMPALPQGADDVPPSDRFWNISRLRKFPAEGSALFYFYSGTLAPPNGNIPPTEGALFEQTCQGEAAETSPKCLDPHEDPRRAPELWELKDNFFQADSIIVDACDDVPCEATPAKDLDY